MTAIPYKMYLFFSALMPSLLYSIIAAVLVWLLSLRVDLNNHLNIALFFSILCFTASFRMIKDIWSLWPYAIHTNKFRTDEIDEKSFLKKPTHRRYLENPLKVAFYFSISAALFIYLISYYLVPYAFSMNIVILWIIGSVIFPVLLFIGLIIATDVFYRSYIHETTTNQDLTIRSYINRYYLLPESFCFLLLNFAIINPLYSIQSMSFDNAWMTVLIMVSITSFLLLLSAYSSPMKNVIGSLNSSLMKIIDINQSHNNDSENRIKSHYKAATFSFIGWWIFLIITQVTIATIFMKHNEQWFYPFLFSAQTIWIGTFLYLRNNMLISAVRQVAQFNMRDDLQQGYMDINPQQEPTT